LKRKPFWTLSSSMALEEVVKLKRCLCHCLSPIGAAITKLPEIGWFINSRNIAHSFGVGKSRSRCQ
jgi:hypothetical protein